jgi:hypothetical protein
MEHGSPIANPRATGQAARTENVWLTAEPFRTAMGNAFRLRCVVTFIHIPTRSYASKHYVHICVSSRGGGMQLLTSYQSPLPFPATHRSRLVPYIYTAALQTYNTGVSLVYGNHGRMYHSSRTCLTPFIPSSSTSTHSPHTRNCRHPVYFDHAVDEQVYGRTLDRNLRSKVPLVPTRARLKRAGV